MSKIPGQSGRALPDLKRPACAKTGSGRFVQSHRLPGQTSLLGQRGRAPLEMVIKPDAVRARRYIP